MKRLTLLLVILLFSLPSFCQISSSFSPGPSYINITEINFGYGLGAAVNEVAYSQYYTGATFIRAYQFSTRDKTIDKTIQAGLGTGISVFNGGYLVPLFVDFRCTFVFKKVSPLVLIDGGVMMNFDKIFENSRLFVNPAIGVSYNISRSLVGQSTVGLFVQQGTHRDSFVSLKSGIVYNF